MDSEAIMKPMARSLMIVLVILVIATLSVLRTAHGQSSLFGGIMSYDPTNDWVLFTDKTGTWHAPLAITNAAAPKDSVIELTVNTDDQFVLQAYSGGTPKSFLDVDVNGSASLYGSAGGGVGVDNNTGDTCIPSTVPSPCGPTSLHVNPDGMVDQYLGQTTAGRGISTILYSADATLTGSFGPYTIFTTNTTQGYNGSNGMYRVTGYMTVTGAAPGSSAQFVMNYTDEAIAQYQNTGTPVTFQSVGDKLPFNFEFYSVAGQPITISILTTGGSPTYTFHVRLESL
jgi:hypothetical protein